MNSPEFAAFVRGWLIRQEGFHDELLAARDHAGRDGFSDPEDLVKRVNGHYMDYFVHKAMVRENDCFALFAPTWFSHLENCFLWVAGFKPTLVFPLLEDAVRGLTDEQRDEIFLIEMETMIAETIIEKFLAEVQESVTAAPVPSMAIGGEEEIEAEVEKIKEGFKRVVEAADALRIKTFIKVIGVLKTIQKIEFLASLAILHKRVRLCGLRRASAASTSMQR